MFKRILFLLFCVTLFYNTCNALYRWRYGNNRVSEVIYVEKTKKVKETPTVIVINNTNNKCHDDKEFYYCDNGDELYKVECDGSLDNEMINVTEMWQQTIHFRMGQFRLDVSDFPTIENIALFMEKHPNVRIGLYGYSSKERGNWDTNFKLAERRLNSVYKALSQFGINVTERVETFVRGVKNHQYDEDSWNQCVIIKVIK